MDVILREYRNIIWKKKWFFLLVLLALASATLLDLSAPLVYKNIANGLTEPYSESSLGLLLENLSHLALLYAGLWLSWRFLEIGIIPLEGGGINVLEKRCFEILQKQKHAFFEDSFSGSLIKQATRFSSSFEIIMDWFLFSFFQNILAITISFVIFYQQQKEFAFYFLMWIVGFLAWTVGYSVWKLRFDKAVAESNSRVGGVYSDAISNIFTVKSFAMESREQNYIDQAADRVYQKRKIAWILTFVSFAVQGLMTFGIELFLIYMMINKWKTGNFQVGEFVLFQSILLMLIHRLWEFGRSFRNFFTALADASEMAEIFSRNDVETDTDLAQPLIIKEGRISFENVSFTYGEPQSDNTGLFRNFSLTINPGEKIALVGPSGSGKTSLTKLIFRFIDPQSGKICFDGINVKNLTLSSLRRQISLVPQQPELFHRSVRDNITLGEKIPTARLIDACEKSRSIEFIKNLPQYFETRVGERGVKLSGGERQRIAIARAFLEDARIVVLDEATSALDSLTEKQIQVAIFELIKDRTAIAIAHRLSTILRMDRILVMEAGQIVEEGSHQALLDRKGKYFEMWQHQIGGFLGE